LTAVNVVCIEQVTPSPPVRPSPESLPRDSLVPLLFSQPEIE
jgi:hypothetical protein